MKTFKTVALGVLTFVVLTLAFSPRAFAAVTGTVSRWVGNLLVFDGTTGNNAFSFDVDGLRGDFGSGSTDYIDSTGTYARVGSGTGYMSSAIPFTLDAIYVNSVPTAVTYGGGTLPARAFTVTGIKFRVRTAGSVGSTNAVFQVSDTTNTCTCSYACNQTQGTKRVTCANGAGTGCVYAASAVLSYSYTGVGDCAGTSADIQGNINVEGNWQ